MWIFEIVLFSLAGPGVLASQKRYTCEQFEIGAYLDPYQVIDSMWKIFYFWANTTELYPIIFSLPVKQVSSVITARSIMIASLAFLVLQLCCTKLSIVSSSARVKSICSTQLYRHYCILY